MTVCKTFINRKNISRVSKSKNNFVITPDWTTLDINRPFFDPISNTYRITVVTEFVTPGTPQELRTRLEGAKRPGVIGLLSHYHKESTDSDIESLVNVARALDHFIPVRPNPKCGPVFGMKILVAVPATSFDNIPFTEDANLQQTLPRASKEITLISSTVRNRVKFARQILDSYAIDVASFNGKVNGIDLTKESKLMGTFIDALDKLLIANGSKIRFNESDTILIGIDSKFHVLYVLINQGDGYARLLINFDQFLLSEAVSNDRTVGYLSILDVFDKIRTKSLSVSWTEFLKRYTIRPPEVKPSVDSTPSNQISKQNIFISSMEAQAKIKKFNSKSSKNEDEKIKEDQELLTPELRKTIAIANDGRLDFIGDTVLSDFDGLLRDINSLEDVYGQALDKVGLKTLVSGAIKCIAKQLPLDEVQKVLDAAKLLNLPCDQFLDVMQNKLGVNVANLPNINIKLKTQLVDCLKDLTGDELQNKLQEIGNKAGIPVNSIDDLIGLNTDVVVNGIGAQGERLLHSLCDENRQDILDQLPSIGIDLSVKLPDLNLNGGPGSGLPSFEVPTITLPDDLPTTDIIGAISEQIESAILDALTTGIVDMIKSIIKQIIDSCGDLDKVNFGQLNINNLLEKGINATKNSPEFQNATRKLLSSFGVSIKDLNTLQNLGNSLINLLDDISAVLSPAEVSNLLGGNPNDDIKKLIGCFIDQKYSALSPAFSTPGSTTTNPVKIADLFQNIGNLVDKQLLLDQIVLTTDLGSDKGLCDPKDDATKQLLIDKGLTSAQAVQQLTAAKQRKLDRLKDLANILEKPNVDNLIPPVFCNPNSKTGGMVPINPPSFKFMLDRTVDTIYDGVHIAFNQDITGFPSSLKQDGTQKVKRIIPRVKKVSFTDDSGNQIDSVVENPEFRRLISQGVAAKDINKDPKDINPDSDENKTPAPDGLAVTVYEDSPITPTFGRSFVAQGLRDNLLKLETDPELFAASSGIVKFVVPSLIDLPNQQSVSPANLPADLKKQFDALTESLSQVSVSKNIIEYKIPKQPTDLKDQYTLTVNYQTAQNTPQTLFSFQKNTDIDPAIVNFINNKSLQPSPAVSSPEGYFSSLVANIWLGGASIYRDGVEVTKPDYARGLGSSTSKIQTITGPLRDLFEVHDGDPTGKPQIYFNLFSDMVANVARQITKSPVFRTDVLNLIKFVPEKTKTGCDAHLLDLDKIKNRMKDALLNSECSDPQHPTADGLSKSQLNPLEESGIEGAVLTFVRLFEIELILRAIFAFSEFRLERIDQLDDVVVSYIEREIQAGISDIATLTKDPVFGAQFIDQTIKLFNKEVGKGNLPGSVTQDFTVAMEGLVTNQLPSVIQRISDLIGTQGDIDIYNILAEDWLPLFDVSSTANSLRLGTSKKQTVSDGVDLKTQRTVRKADTQDAIFDFNKGAFILEKYIRIEEKEGSGIDSETNHVGRTPGLFGVVSLSEWHNFINSPDFITYAQNKSTADLFAHWSYGLRLVYVPPIVYQFVGDFVEFDTQRNPIPNFQDNPFLTVVTDNTNGPLESKRDKAFDLTEEIDNDSTQSDLQTGEALNFERKIFSFPLVCVETAQDLNAVSFDAGSITFDTFDIEGGWNQNSDKLSALLTQSPEFKFLFQYIFPVNRIISLLTIYNITYLSNIKKISHLFDGTKTSLKGVFQALLNGGDYTYQDKYTKDQLGGNKGTLATAQNNANTDTDIPGLSLAAIAARTPFLILKGLVELIDPNISIARKIVDTAKEHDKNIPIVLASLAQLPINVFGPIPFGIGIGPPITPLGFIYLALDIDGIFDSAKGKQVKRDEISTNIAGLGIDLNAGINKICPDNGV